MSDGSLPPAAQRLLQAIDERRASGLLELISLYERMPPEGRLFLERADPTTLKWLANARKEEIEQLDEAINLVRATRTVGRFTKWAMVGAFGIFFAMVSFGEYVVRFVTLLRGGRP